MTAKKIILNGVVPVVAVVGALMVLNQLVATRPQTPTRPSMPNVPIVSVEEARPYERALHVKAVGRVKPARAVTLQPEVSGRVVEVAPDLVPGGILSAGTVAVRIDDRPYRLVVSQHKANVAKARVDLQLESGRKAVAEREWSLLEEGIEASPEGKALALRKPQQRLAEVQVASAASALERARLDVERTTIKLPFNALVTEETVEPGLLATPQTPLAKLVGTDAFWVEVTVPLDEVARIAVPGLDEVPPGGGARALVRQVGTGANVVAREGRVVRLLGELDPLGAQARLLIEIPDPLGLEGAARALPLFLGAFVEVEIDATPFDAVVAIPRRALRDGKAVWVLTAEDTLDIREVTIAWREPGQVLVTAGVTPGERVITSRLTTPVTGMDLKIAAPAKTASGQGKAKADGDEAATP